MLLNKRNEPKHEAKEHILMRMGKSEKEYVQIYT
jgi:hypothetical protein